MSSRIPANATTIPTQVRAVVRTPARRASSTAQTGWVATSAVAEATVVSRTPVIHVPKWAASSTPEAPMRRHSRRPTVTARHPSDRHANGAVAAAPSRQRQNEIASAGARIAALNGPEVAAARTATTSSVLSSADGRRRSSALLGTMASNRTGRPARGLGVWHSRPMTDPDTVTEPATAPAPPAAEAEQVLPSYGSALVTEATKASGLLWLAVGGAAARPAWRVWSEGALHTSSTPARTSRPPSSRCRG